MGRPPEAQLEKAGGQKGASPHKRAENLETWEPFSLDFRLPQSVFFICKNEGDRGIQSNDETRNNSVTRTVKATQTLGASTLPGGGSG